LPRHTVTALIGPSGCGKTTFLRCLNRMHELSEGGWITGNVLLDGEDIYDPGVDAIRLRRRIGMVFQRPTPFPTMSIYDNVAAGLRVNGGRPRAEVDAAVEGALRRAALWDEVKDRLRHSALALSGGQQPRLYGAVRMTTVVQESSPAFPLSATRRGGQGERSVRLSDRPSPILDVRTYSFWYGPTQALFDVTVAIPRRAVTALIGPSGCGKSTF